MISYEEYEKMSLTSKERVDLYPQLDDDGIIKMAESLVKYTCVRRPNYYVPTTYEEDILYFILPELIRRLRE